MEDTNKKNNGSYEPRFNRNGHINQADAIKILCDIEYNDLKYQMYQVLHDVLGNAIPPKLHDMDSERQEFYKTYLQGFPENRQNIVKKVARIRALDQYQTCLLLESNPLFAIESELSEEDKKDITLKTIVLCPEYNAAFNERNQLCADLKTIRIKQEYKNRFPIVIEGAPAICKHANTIAHDIIPALKKCFTANTHS